jgi:uncharacterized protein YukE
MRSLSDELLKLKTTVERYEQTQQILKDVSQSTQKIGEACKDLSENTKSLYVRLQQVAFEDKFHQIQDNMSRMIQQQEDLATKLERIGFEEKFQQLKNNSSELMQQQQEQAKKLKLTQNLLIVSVLLQVVSMVVIFLVRR